MPRLTTHLPRRAATLQTLTLAAVVLRARVDRRLRRAGIGRPEPLDLATLGAPDSALAARATEHIRAVHAPWLLGHALRTHAFGVALARRAGIRFDPELFYVSALMHDLGLEPAYDGPGDFELEGARAARDWMRANGAPDERADRVHEAIALHTRFGVVPGRSAEGRLVHLGAGADVVGARLHDLHRDTIRAVLGAFPREDFGAAIADALADQVARKPGCHAATFAGTAFTRAARANPLDRMAPRAQAAA